ncbi:Predicted arabinose efflux permease, MFS family [Sulfobacillus thermosulfidooxidans DSM 9293]|uniref:Predicted arabinose efflux permease, MFS family n=1 Tax=Sulfobacillus thermosulfidooxidans (strain DSM 9293 / VKM B-1269 / AT-1) TaxID=929705 RepID=A0A1W1WB12_SULTA|nr:MFS transporter [Sulfobacillus thermosulfidooxidans]SMC03481.1 Predicted arabinose efflux permease, MFS family [Sulfobacillus thermosulfidooxidans DSM 9293]
MQYKNTERSRLMTGWFTLFVIGTDLFVISPLLSLIARTIRISPAAAGWMVTIFAVIYVIAAPKIGALSDILGRRRIIVGGLLLFSTANFLTSIASSFILLLVSRAFAGLAAAAVTPSVYAIAGDTAPEGRRGSWLAIVGSGLLTALWIGAPVGTLLAQRWGWPSVFGILSGSALALAFLNERAWPHQVSASSSRSTVEWCQLITAVGPTVFWGAGVYGFYTYLGVILHLYHYSASQLAMALVAYGLGAVSGSLSGGKFADRFGARRIATTSLILLGATLLVIPFSLFIPILLIVNLFLYALMGYAFFPSYQSKLSHDYPGHRTTILAWNNSALYIGIALGSAMGSFVIQEWQADILPILSGVIILIGSAVSAKEKQCLPISDSSRTDSIQRRR